MLLMYVDVACDGFRETMVEKIRTAMMPNVGHNRRRSAAVGRQVERRAYASVDTC